MTRRACLINSSFNNVYWRDGEGVVTAWRDVVSDKRGGETAARQLARDARPSSRGGETDEET